MLRQRMLRMLASACVNPPFSLAPKVAHKYAKQNQRNR
jgi:hypothetical protein